ncbi:MAG: MASE1 domain-containing protein [Candidatus Sumerlaeaceae bacterium]|nr:MASE1 domain-containing protein [Candidatus Sumerlaeaceae bacterium]
MARASEHHVKSVAANAILALLRSLVIVIAYVWTARFGRRIDSLSEELRVFFPQSGIALAALFLCGLRYWPAVAISAWLNLILVRTPLTFAYVLTCWQDGRFPRCLFTDDPAAYALAPYVVAGNTLSALAAAFMLRRVMPINPRFDQLNDCYRFLLYSVLIAPIISASFVTARFIALEPIARIAWSDLFWRRWLGHAVSNLIIAPAVLVWSQLPRRRWSVGQFLELFALLCALALLGIFVFTRSSPIGLLNYPVSYAPFPLILWAALRFGSRGAASASLIIAGLAVYGSSQRAGPFMRETDPQSVTIALLQTYLLVVSATGLIVGASSNERRHNLEALARSREELRHLAAQLQAAREQERAHLARELHDELAQLLAGIKMGIAQVGKFVAGNEVLEKRLQTLTELTNEAVSSMRNLATNLRPGILDDLGLVEAVRWQCEEFQNRFGIPVSYEPPLSLPKLSTEIETALFRVLQESLTNVAKHAKATHVQVRLESTHSRVQLEVSDDGVGIGHVEQNSSRGLGLVSMRERVLLLHGNFSVNPNEVFGHGTVIRAEIPLDAANLKLD